MIEMKSEMNQSDENEWQRSIPQNDHQLAKNFLLFPEFLTTEPEAYHGNHTPITAVCPETEKKKFAGWQHWPAQKKGKKGTCHACIDSKEHLL